MFLVNSGNLKSNASITCSFWCIFFFFQIINQLGIKDMKMIAYIMNGVN
jgi:hypothetical protein